jgi:hypothetical protein
MKLYEVAFMLIAVVLVGAIAREFYKEGPRMMEAFNGRNGKLLFNGSYPTAPVVCLSGNRHIPCTAFSSG